MVATALGCKRLEDMCGPTFIPPQRLKKPKALGQGAYAVVERARLLPGELLSGQSSGAAGPSTVAVKRLKPDVLENETDCMIFIREARLLIKMEPHPAIIKYIGLGCQDATSPEAQWRTLYLVQEYASGGTLKKLILNQMISPTRKLYSLADAVRWGAQIAEGLAHLHSRTPSIIHRDLKPDNLLLATGHSGQQDAKLADFGLHRLVPLAAKQRSEGTVHGAGGMLADLHLSYPFSPCAGPRSPTAAHAAEQLLREDAGRGPTYCMTGKTGSFVYMAPEVMLCGPYNEKVDVFSFGVILFELLHRKLIVTELMYLGDGGDAEQHAYKVASGFRHPISADLPLALQQLVHECWAQSPEKRPSMSDVAARLREVHQSGEVEEVEGRHGPAASAGCCTLM